MASGSKRVLRVSKEAQPYRTELTPVSFLRLRRDRELVGCRRNERSRLRRRRWRGRHRCGRRGYLCRCGRRRGRWWRRRSRGRRRLRGRVGRGTGRRRRRLGSDRRRRAERQPSKRERAGSRNASKRDAHDACKRDETPQRPIRTSPRWRPSLCLQNPSLRPDSGHRSTLHSSGHGPEAFVAARAAATRQARAANK